jgi:hypothetical protein
VTLNRDGLPVKPAGWTRRPDAPGPDPARSADGVARRVELPRREDGLNVLGSCDVAIVRHGEGFVMKSSTRHGGAPTRIAALGLLAAGLLRPAGVVADGFTDAGEGGTVFPVQNDDVRMVSERVEFQFGDGPPRVQAHYDFENLTNKTLHFVMAFPVRGGLAEDLNDPRVDPLGGHFSAFVDGVEVAGRRVKNACDVRSRTPCFDFVYRFDIDFAPHGRRVVDYDYPAGGAGNNTWSVATTTFIFSTGRLWAGTIGDIEVIYRFPPDQSSPPGFVGFDLPYVEVEGYSGPDSFCFWDGVQEQWPDFNVGSEEHRDACELTLHSEHDTIFVLGTRFETTVTCDSETMVVTLQGHDVEPRSDLTLYRSMDGTSGPLAGWCRPGASHGGDAGDAAPDATGAAPAGSDVAVPSPDASPDAARDAASTKAPPGPVDVGPDRATARGDVAESTAAGDASHTPAAPSRGCSCSWPGLGGRGDESWTLLPVLVCALVLRRRRARTGRGRVKQA